jgi:hypothetical protein
MVKQAILESFEKYLTFINDNTKLNFNKYLQCKIYKQDGLDIGVNIHTHRIELIISFNNKEIGSLDIAAQQFAVGQPELYFYNFYYRKSTSKHYIQLIRLSTNEYHLRAYTIECVDVKSKMDTLDREFLLLDLPY